MAEQLRGADLVLHAGDVCTAGVLEELAAYAPVHAVLGNNDGPDVAAWGAPETLELDVGRSPGGDGPRQRTGDRSGTPAADEFPECDLVVFGHSHIPMDVGEDGFRILNPGSPTDRRRQPHGTLAVLQVSAGVLRDVELVEVT